jgi:hypothetical protein
LTFWIFAQSADVPSFRLRFSDSKFAFLPVALITEKEEVVGNHCRFCSFLSAAATQHDLGLLYPKLETTLLTANFLLFKLIKGSHFHQVFEFWTACTDNECS